MRKYRATVISGLVLVASGLLASPASAHVIVQATPGAPGAKDAVLHFTAAAESATGGISKLDVLSSPAIAAGEVTFVDGPTGWKVSSSSGGGFTLEGPALPKGQDADISVRVTQLPDAPKVTFKVVQSYSDGSVERWIDVSDDVAAELEHPAPVVTLTAGAANAVSPAPAEDEDEEEEAHALATTGTASRLLVQASGSLLALGGIAIAAGGRRRRPLSSGVR